MPTLDVEIDLARRFGPWVAGCDEVGRGALAGPVSVGMVLLRATDAAVLDGVRDSKLVSASARAALAPVIQDWAAGWGVGHATAAEIDEFGILPATGMAGRRALIDAQDRAGASADSVLLDGNFDWLTPRDQGSLFEALEPSGESPVPPVVTRIKADLSCVSVAAASILAKVERDELLSSYHDAEPHFGWVDNKGYGTAAHRAAIAAHGPSEKHRRSWRLT
ncbi:ribonuclease HII [Zhihengliuella flava]|uniref:Ribonuclease n=1 Tax=Zhihengliuella flava TaxID=1285193 RepID=A0A931GHQ8_9MICC|nr:ribonuclease HII [Zhihengliuella flava]